MSDETINDETPEQAPEPKAAHSEVVKTDAGTQITACQCDIGHDHDADGKALTQVEG